jgi:hypothetical protein
VVCYVVTQGSLSRKASTSCPCGTRLLECTVNEEQERDLWMDGELCDWTRARY